MERNEVLEMIERLKKAFEESAVEEKADWYTDVAQGIAFAHNSIVTSTTETGTTESAE